MIARTQTSTRTYRTPAPSAAPHRRQTAFLPGVAASLVSHPAPMASAAGVRNLLDAAGPLTLRDIAGGTGIAPGEAARIVRHMRARGLLHEDEWGRHSLRATFCGTD